MYLHCSRTAWTSRARPSSTKRQAWKEMYNTAVVSISHTTRYRLGIEVCWHVRCFGNFFWNFKTINVSNIALLTNCCGAYFTPYSKLNPSFTVYGRKGRWHQNVEKNNPRIISWSNMVQALTLTLQTNHWCLMLTGLRGASVEIINECSPVWTQMVASFIQNLVRDTKL